MSSKRNRDRSSLLGATQLPPQKTVFEADAEIYGAIEKVDAGRQVAEAVNIDEIRPDPRQPRRALPSAIRELWDGLPYSLSDVFSRWWGLAQHERGEDIDLHALLAAESDGDLPDPAGKPMQEALFELVRLAISVRRDGLLNPITITRSGPFYQIETGERRWLVYHLLRWMTQEEQWDRIPARLVEKTDVWRQAAENNARQNLNAIGRARQFAILLMDILTTEKAADFQPFDAFPHERQFYAQVVEIDIPHGKAHQLMSAMGVNTRMSLSRYRTLLTLPDDFWTASDDRNTPESHLIEAAATKVYKTSYDVENDVSDLEIENPNEAVGKNNPPPPPDAITRLVDLMDQSRTKIEKRFTSAVKKGGAGGKEQVRNLIADYRKWLDELENRLDS